MARLAGALLVCVVALGLAAPACAQRRELQEARQAYAQGDYAQVRAILYPMVGGSVASIDDPLLVNDARRYLGAAYVLLDEPDQARRQFEWLMRGQTLAELQRAELEPTLFFASVRALYDEIRTARMTELRRVEQAQDDQAAQLEARRRAAMRELLRIARNVEVTQEIDPLPTFVPFGVGQFTNGADELGWFFAVSQALAALTAVVSLSVFSALDDQHRRFDNGDPGVLPVDESALTGLIWTHWTADLLLIGLAVAGIVEARVSFVPTRTRRIEQEIPSEVLEELDLAVTPGGVSLQGRFW